MDIAFYKLLDDGTIIRIADEDLNQQFISINIIAVLLLKSRHLYLWIGENASRELQNHIPSIEPQILSFHPGIAILRHFTLSGMKDETIAFLAMLNVDAQAYQAHAQQWDSFRKDSLIHIQQKTEQMNKYLDQEDYDAALLEINQILDLAETINASDLLQTYEHQLKQIINRKNDLSEFEIQDRIASLEQAFRQLNANHQFSEAKYVLNQIQELLLNSIDRGLKRQWGKLAQLKLAQAEELWKIEQEKGQFEAERQQMLNDYTKLLQEIQNHRESKQWKLAIDDCHMVARILNKLEHFDEIKKINGFIHEFEDKLKSEVQIKHETALLKETEEKELRRKRAEEEVLQRKHAEEEALQRKHAEEETLQRKHAEEEVLRRKRAEEEVLQRRHAEEEALQRKQTEEEELQRKQAKEEETLQQKQTEEEALQRKQAKEEELQRKQVEEEARRKQAAEQETQCKEIAEEEARKKKAIEITLSNEQQMVLLNEIITDIEKSTSKIEVGYDNYVEMMQKANLIESRDLMQAQQILLRCYYIILCDEEKFKNAFPTRTKDKEILIRRLRRYGILS